MPTNDIAHYGIKGMHWGVRKSDDAVYRLQSSTVNVDAGIHKTTRDDALVIAKLMKDRYGYNIQRVRALTEDNPHYDPNTLAFVENNQKTGGANDGTIFVQPGDMRHMLKGAEDEGWNGRGTGNVKGLITHESSHALFHSNQKVTTGLLGGEKVTGGDIKARRKAFKDAEKVAKQDGQSIWDISDYARTSANLGELEGELFSNYHWGTNPPRYVDVWGKSLHHELGLDPTPFKEVK